MQTSLKIGDLVCLSHVPYYMQDMGIILAKHSHGDWEVYWFRKRELFIESSRDIRIVELPEES